MSSSGRRVVLATSNFPPEFLGGTERVVLAVAQSLREQGDEVLVLSGSEKPHEGVDVVEETVDGFPVRRIPRLPDEVYSLWIERERVRDLCRSVVREFGADVLHLNHWVTLSTELIRAVAEDGVPTVVTLHDMWTTCPRFFRRPPEGVTCPTGAGREPCGACAHLSLGHIDLETLKKGIGHRDHHLGRELECACVITTPSESAAENIARHLPTDRRIEVVPHGLLEPVTERRDPSPEESSPDQPLRLGTFGNLVEEKGVLLLVWACRGLPNVELHYYGPFLAEACRTEAVERAEEFGVDLHLHGSYSNSERHPALDLDVAVFPSLCEETYGLVVDEALARGTPVVVSDRGALSERVGGGGLVSSVDSVEALHEALRPLCENRAAVDRLRSGIADSFSTIRDAALSYRQIYQEAIDSFVGLRSDQDPAS
ncbi:MAG: glycosyltransferase [Planctomycetota bacterium]